ncbi:MAG: hypothetical protein ACOZE7_21605 [Pseudomonadota bacterium]|jgi:hypothetical protein|uniref:hypothetical protein n=1 Tax=Aquabacterium sp. TaxID=1872578 RepID=UPI003BB05579
MRPLFAIAPLALALALLGPSSQASQTDRSWAQTVMSWVFDQDDAGQSTNAASDTSASFRSLSDRIAR